MELPGGVDTLEQKAHNEETKGIKTGAYIHIFTMNGP